MAKTDLNRTPGSILGDITPNPGTTDHLPGHSGHDRDEDAETTHSGADDVIGAGGAGTVTGGTRNYPQRAGATGGDIGNRPE
jgi:hypothetical protein